MKTGPFFLSARTQPFSAFAGIASMSQSEASRVFLDEHIGDFFVGLVAGTIIALIVSNYFNRAKTKRLLSQILTPAKTSHNATEKDADKSVKKNTSIATDTDLNKVFPLHEKEIESLVRLASTLSHDLNNLIGSMMGYASLLKKRVQPDTKEFHYTEIIENSSKQMAQLVKRVLGFSQLDTKTMKVLDLNQFIRAVSEEFSSVRGEKFSVIVSAASLPALVQASTDQLKQTLLAVFDNAADSMKDGGVIECLIGVSEKSGTKGDSVGNQTLCTIEITDHGTGMSEEVRQRIFEPFFTTKSGRKYAGLSLSQVFNIVKLHGGTISVDTSPEMGTKVRICFPLFVQEEVTTPIESAPALHELKGSKILVVDDEENVRQLGFDVLTEQGFHVVTANDGLDALGKLKENPDVQLVIMDMIMPIMTGKDACIEIKKMEHPPKILICTGFSELSDLKTILGTYAEGLIRKPYNTRELVSTVENLLKKTP